MDYLDISGNERIRLLEIDEMPSLRYICVWVLPFPPEGIEIRTKHYANLIFSQECTTDLKQMLAQTIRVTPNPISDLLHIQLPDSKIYRVELFDLLGRRLMADQVDMNSDVLNLSHLRPGTYILVVTNDEVSHTQLILKQ